MPKCFYQKLIIFYWLYKHFIISSNAYHGASYSFIFMRTAVFVHQCSKPTHSMCMLCRHHFCWYFCNHGAVMFNISTKYWVRGKGEKIIKISSNYILERFYGILLLMLLLLHLSWKKIMDLNAFLLREMRDIELKKGMPL